MANIGSVRGRTFAFPYQQGQGTAGQGAAIPDQSAMPQMGMEAPGSLQFVRDKTKGVYDKYYKLKNFVSSMWKNYNIDVTNPNFNDELSMKANQIYQESIADLKFTADDLANSQRMLERDAAKTGQRLAAGYDLQAQPYSRGVGQAFVPQSNITPRTTQVLTDYQKQFYDKGTRDVANKNLDLYKTQLEQDAMTAEQSGRADMAEMIRNDIKAIQGAMYSSEKDNMLALRYKIAQDAKDKEEAKRKVNYTDLWSQWDEVKQGDLRSLEGLQGAYGPIFIPGSLHYNYAKNKIEGVTKINAKGDTRDVEIDLDDIRGGYLGLLQEHDPSYKGTTYDELLNNTKEIRAKFPELSKATYDSDPDFFRSLEYVVGDLLGGGEEGEYEVLTPDGKKKTGDKYSTNKSQFIGAVSRLNNVAENKGLRVPKGTTKFVGLPDGTIITKVEDTSPWFGNKKIRIILEADGMEAEEELDPKDPKDRKFLRELVYSNDITMNDSVSPNYKRIGTKTDKTEGDESLELTPEQIKAEELIRKYGGQ